MRNNSKCNICKFEDDEFCLHPSGVCSFKRKSLKNYKSNRLLLEQDVVRVIDSHIDDNGTLDENILSILREVKGSNKNE